MIKTLNKYFPVFMICLIFFTAVVFSIKKDQIDNFVSESTDHTIVISKEDINEEEKKRLIRKLRALTYQEVEIKESDDEIYLVIKCPPEKCGFFSDWVFSKKWNLNNK